MEGVGIDNDLERVRYPEGEDRRLMRVVPVVDGIKVGVHSLVLEVILLVHLLEAADDAQENLPGGVGIELNQGVEGEVAFLALRGTIALPYPVATHLNVGHSVLCVGVADEHADLELLDQVGLLLDGGDGAEEVMLEVAAGLVEVEVRVLKKAKNVMT